MNIINRLTWRHMMKNKRRTIVTIIGVVISVAMITAVASLVESFIQFAKEDHLSREGEWHVAYEGITPDQLEAIQDSYPEVKSFITKDLGYAAFGESNNPAKPYLFLKGFDELGFEQFPIKLLEGRLPEKERELLIPEHMLRNSDKEFSLGDELLLDFGRRVIEDDEVGEISLFQTSGLRSQEHEIAESLVIEERLKFKIVGIMERPSWEPYQAPGFTTLTYLSDQSTAGVGSLDALVVWDKVNKKQLAESQALGEKLGIDQISFNDDLLRFYGISKHDFLIQSVYSLVAIIMVVIIVGSISLIYNAFAISISERLQYLGMLSSVGATRQQKRNSILFEGSMIGLISIPLGILAGVGGIALTLPIIDRILKNIGAFEADLHIHVTPMVILLSAVLAFLTIFISAYIPAVRVSRIPAVEAIRQTDDIKLTTRKIKSPRLIGRIFGIEGEIALKNLKRHKRRYDVTVFSLVISIVLFLTVSFTGQQIKTSSYSSMVDINYDIALSSSNRQEALPQELVDRIHSMEGVTEVTVQQYSMLETRLGKDQVHESLRELAEDEKVNLSITLNALDDRSFKAYVEGLGLSADDFVSDDSFKGILVNRSISPREKFGYITPVDIEEKEQFMLSHYDWELDRELDLTEIEASVLTDKNPPGVEQSVQPSEVNFIVPMESMAKIKEAYGIEVLHQLTLSSEDPVKTQEEIEKSMNQSLMIFNHEKNRQEEAGILLIMAIFTYGFISLITLISIANIFNTISTSVSLRTREFGMLRAVGMTAKSFRRMIYYESFFYGIKSLLFGLPISFVIMYFIYREFAGAFDYPFEFPWLSLSIVIFGVFLVVGLAMLYASSQVKKLNIMDSLRMDHI